LRAVRRKGVNGQPDTVLSGNNFWKANGNIYIVDELAISTPTEYASRRPPTTRSTCARPGHRRGRRGALSIQHHRSKDLAGDNGLTTRARDRERAPAGSSLTTYELKQPIFYINIPPTEGRRRPSRSS